MDNIMNMFKTRAVFTNVIDNIMNHVYWQTIVVFTNVIDNIMNHVYWQTRVVFTNAIDNIMNHVYWQTRAMVFTNVIDNIMANKSGTMFIGQKQRRYLPMSLIIL